MIFAALSAFSILRGMNSICVKIAQKGYIEKTLQSIYMTVVFSLFQGLFLFITPPYYRYSFKLEMLVYPLCYSIFYAIGYVLFINSLTAGPTSLSNIIYNFQLLVPIIAGLLIWNESITLYQFAGLVLFGVILLLFNQSSFSSGDESRKISVRWALMALGSAFFVGLAVIFTKQYMLRYDYAIKEYLIAYNMIVVLLGAPCLVFMKHRGTLQFITEKKFLAYTAAAGFIQNITNIIYMYYITKFKSASFFPLMGILNIISIVLMSRLLLKEKISKKAYVGILLSIAAIYLLGKK